MANCAPNMPSTTGNPSGGGRGNWWWQIINNSTSCFQKDGTTPLKEYATLEEAEQAVQYVLQEYGNQQTPYVCNTCGKYHLSPSDRVTKSTLCSCLDGNDDPKQLYETYDDAHRRAQIIEHEKGIKLEIYPCPINKGFHLTKNY